MGRLGSPVRDARENLGEALELFFEQVSLEEQERRKGSPVVMLKSNGGETVTAPDHREFAVGALRAIVCQSGLPREDFEVESPWRV